jgi:hypothetical protein
MRWAGHVACMAEKINAYRILVEKPERKMQLGKQDVGGRIILKLILYGYNKVVGTGLICLRIGTIGWLL